MSIEKEFVKKSLSELDISAENIHEIQDGSDTLFQLEDKNSRSLVVKFRTYSSLEKSWFEKEPLIIPEIRQKTDLPVPEIIDSSISNEKPFFVMNKISGKTLSEASKELEEDEVLKIMENLGRYLAELHSTKLGLVSGFGWLVNSEGSIKLREEENWRKMFESMIDYRIDSLEDTRFDEYLEQIKEFSEKHYHLLESLDNPALIHDDFRPGNIMINKRNVSGILDWARASSADPEYDLINSIYHFQEEIGIDNNLIEKRFISGYTSVGTLSDNFEDKKDLYLLNAISGKMTGFANFWGENYSEEKQEEIEKRLRENLETILN